MNMVKMTLNDLMQVPSDEELRELAAAEAMQPVVDEDSPEMTAEQLIQFRKMHRENRNKQTVSLRLSPDTLKKAKAYGKGYTSFLSRLLDAAIDNEELVRRCV